MIRFQRTARILLGRGQEAGRWAREVAELLNRKYPEAQVQVFASRFGEIGRVFWHADFTDLTAMDAWQQKVGADEEYWELVGKVSDLLIEGSTEDTVLGSV